MADSLRISVKDLQARMDKGDDFVVLDTRNPNAWAESEEKLPKAIRVSSDNLETVISGIPKDKPIVVYCT
jgi:rhodanese-related sulfurtransferase